MSVDEEMNNGNTGSSLTPSLQLLECTAACNNISIMTEVKLSADSSDITVNCPLAANLVLPNHTSLDSYPNSEKLCLKTEGDENHINHSSTLPAAQQQQHQQQQQQHKQQQQQQHPQQPKLSKRRNTSNFGFNHPASKRRRRANSESDSVLPSNFLLGGNIFDPLNLNSLLDEEVNKALNAETPKSSPLPSKNREPVEILIPRDITDPLNLNSGVADGNVLVSPLKSGGRRRNRNRHHGGGGGGGGGGGTAVQQLNLSEAGKAGDGKPAADADPVAIPADSAPKEPGAATAAGVTLNAAKEVTREEVAVSEPACAPSARRDPMTSPVPPVATNQHPGRRKRRRNSGKTDPPVASCGAAAKPQGQRPPGGPQGFSTPKTGAKTAHGGRPQQNHHHHHHQHQQHKPHPQQKFQYGNYNKYYGYRNPGSSEDPRLRVLRPEWFRGKEVLDLGCNAGHVTLYVAKVLRPARILGVDIDGGLVDAARKNIRHYLSDLETRQAREKEREEREEEEKGRRSQEGVEAGGDKQEERMAVGGAGQNGEALEMEDLGTKELQDGRQEEQGTKEEHGRKEEEMEKVQEHPRVADQGVEVGLEQEGLEGRRRRREQQRSRMEEVQTEERVEPSGGPGGCHFPVSLRISRGPIAAPPLTEKPPAQQGEFPSNVSFLKTNYVLESDRLLLTQRPEYDVILCLSVTKWVHLNWGDDGLKRLFQRAYRHLRPGGLFILEPQPWDSYIRRKKLTDNISKNYRSLRLKPDQFTNYLTTEVGFASYEFIGTPNSSAKGFQRPIYLFHK